MTALQQYDRLEAAGLWRDGDTAQRRDVIVGLRDATIVLTDPKTDMPLTQWSLPAIVRVSEVAGFVTFASHQDGGETLEIDDTAMIAALDQVRRAIDRRRKRPGRLRQALMAAGASVVIGIAAIWMPLRMNSFTAARLPDAARAAIGAMALADIEITAGSACTARMGQIAAESLARRVNPAHPPKILVLRTGLARPTALPGNMILLPYDLVSTVEGPDVLAGLVLAEQARANAQDPILAVLHHAGFLASFRLLSSGALPPNALDGYGVALANAVPAGIDPAQLQAEFAAAKITAQPYLTALGADAPADMADPMATESAAGVSDPAVLDDAAFLGLQYICGT